MAKVVVGPVLGKVTSTSARVLFEVDSGTAVSISLAHRGKEHKRLRLRQRANRPRVVQFTGLSPATEYDIEVAGARPQKGVEGRVRTLAESVEEFRVAAVSCNRPDSGRRDDLWKALDERADQIDLVLHLGDQVYGDNAFTYSRNLLGPGEHLRKRIPADTRLKIEEAFRDLYRTNWTWDHAARFLARTPSLMIWDDHEIRDDWGSRRSHHIVEGGDHPEMVVGKIARQIYREYQGQLNGKPIEPRSHEGHMHTFGPYGVLFIDQRGGRSFGDTPEERSAQDAIPVEADRVPYLGLEQWADIDQALQPDGLFAGVRCLIVATSVPLVYLTETFGRDGRGEEFFADDLADHWSNGLHRHEQVRMLRALTDWQRRGDGRREVLVLGGDVHVGGRTKITRQDGEVLWQLITSPVTNRPPRWWEFPFLRSVLELQRSIAGEFRVDHHDFTNHRNYGLATLTAGSQETDPAIVAQLITE